MWKATGVRVHQNMESISKTAHYIIGQIDKAEKSNPTEKGETKPYKDGEKVKKQPKRTPTDYNAMYDPDDPEL